MNDTVSRVSVRILEKEYQFTCPPDERAALLDSAEFLNAEMKKIRDSGKVIGLDRFGESAPAGVLFKEFGFTVENVVKAVESFI